MTAGIDIALLCMSGHRAPGRTARRLGLLLRAATRHPIGFEVRICKPANWPRATTGWIRSCVQNRCARYVGDLMIVGMQAVARDGLRDHPRTARVKLSERVKNFSPGEGSATSERRAQQLRT